MDRKVLQLSFIWQAKKKKRHPQANPKEAKTREAPGLIYIYERDGNT